MTRAATHKRGVTLDTGALIALERRRASALALLRVCRQGRVAVTIPAVVVSEWWRGAHATLLEIGEIEPLSSGLAKSAGQLLAKAARRDTIDAIVVASAAQRGDLLVTDDPRDLTALAKHVTGVDVVEI